MANPRPRDLFDSDNPVEIADRFETYLGALEKAPRVPVPDRGMSAGASTFERQLADPEVTKALSPDVLSSVQQQLAAARGVSPDVAKDITVAGGLAGGLVQYDLEAPAKMLVPRQTPLRNRIPRRRGVGTAHQYKAITGFTGSGSGGVANLHPGISETTTTTFGSVPYLRGPKISYAGINKTVGYSQFSVSDQVSWAAQYAGQGYQNIRQLSQTSVLYASMLLEERMILGGRGTGTGFAGALAAPANVAVTTPAAGGGQVAQTGVLANIWVKVTATTSWGESVLSSAATSAWTAGDVTVVTWDHVAGATGYNVYVSTHATTDPTDTARWKQNTVAYTDNTATLQGALVTSGTAASTVTADTTAYANGYDGIIAWATGADAGYVHRADGVLSTSNPGNEFNTVFAELWSRNQADPDTVIMNGLDRKQLSDTIKTGASTSSYRIMVDNSGEAHGAQVGTLVAGVQNEVTGKMTDLMVHPFCPQGIAPVVSWTLPIPDSGVSDVFAIINVQDYMGIEWPVNQFAFETSSYWYGTLINYAPGWSGAVTGIATV